MEIKVAMIALGCSKNVINSEQMLWRINNEGMKTVTDLDTADVTIVNTCGFIESAKQEAIDQILELTSFPGKIIVTGCLAERYQSEILSELPEINGLVGCGSFDDIVKVIHDVMDGKEVTKFDSINAPVSETERILTSPAYTAYIKVAEGCDNCCSYCVIPSLRGAFRSRTMENILNEARILVAQGVTELILVAQDTTRYGLDLYGKRKLSDLLKEICAIEGLEWVRLHYLYPEEIDDELVNTVKIEQKIVKYLDIPIQHCNSDILRRMNRRSDKETITALFDKLKAEISGIVLRTSVIVGFPGETEEQFSELCEFLKEQKIQRAGVFTYSAEEGTPAAEMPDQIDDEVKKNRAAKVMEIQSEIMEAYNQAHVGKILEVLAEGYDRYADLYYGRSYADSPEVDGKIFFTSQNPVTVGKLLRVKITDVFENDLHGKARG